MQTECSADLFGFAPAEGRKVVAAFDGLGGRGIDWAFADGKPAPFKRDRPMKLLTGDLDVFGDGSATLLSTPGAYAGPSVAFGPPRQDRLAPIDRRRRAFQGQLG